MAVKPIPDGYHTVTPYLAIRNAAAALEFYKKRGYEAVGAVFQEAGIEQIEMVKRL